MHTLTLGRKGPSRESPEIGLSAFPTAHMLPESTPP